MRCIPDEQGLQLGGRLVVEIKPVDQARKAVLGADEGGIEIILVDEQPPDELRRGRVSDCARHEALSGFYYPRQTRQRDLSHRRRASEHLAVESLDLPSRRGGGVTPVSSQEIDVPQDP